MSAPFLIDLTPTPADAPAAAALAAAQYWNAGLTADELERAHLGSTAWVLARAEGRVVGTARAIGDGAKHAWIYDVVVDPGWRGRGVGDALMKALLDRPSVAGARVVWLATRDADPFYARMGFQYREALPAKPWRSVEMALVRGGVTWTSAADREPSAG